MMKEFFILPAISVFATVMFSTAAADEASAGTGSAPEFRQEFRQEFRRRNPRMRQGMQGNRSNSGFNGAFSRIIAEEEIRLKFPAEYAEIDKAMAELEKKQTELAEKAKIQLPVTMESSLRKLRLADPQSYTEAINTLKTDRRNGFAKLNKLAAKHNISLFPSRRTGMHEFRKVEAPAKTRNIAIPNFRKLREKFPEEMKQYEEMRQKDTAKAKIMLEELIKKMGN